MKILFLEDQGSVEQYVTPLLEDNGHKVFVAGNIADADTYLENNIIDCLIIDLNLNNNGLPPKYISDTQLGIITGWIWLSKIVFPKHDNLRNATIIYTDYLDVLKKEVKSAELKGIKGIAKRGDESIEDLLEFIKKINTQNK
jgi:hypothetical protein